MGIEDVDNRLARIASAIGKLTVVDYSQYTRLGTKAHGAVHMPNLPKAFAAGGVEGPGAVYMHAVSKERLSRSDLENYLYAAIYNVATMKERLKAWVRKLGKDDRTVEAVVDGSPALQIILDLYNADKHQYPAHTKHSGKDPRFGDVGQAWRLAGPGGRFRGLGGEKYGYPVAVVTLSKDQHALGRPDRCRLQSCGATGFLRYQVPPPRQVDLGAKTATARSSSRT
jgi:hypothetical protein